MDSILALAETLMASPWLLLLVLVLAVGDSLVPMVPAETVVLTAGTSPSPAAPPPRCWSWRRGRGTARRRARPSCRAWSRPVGTSAARAPDRGSGDREDGGGAAHPRCRDHPRGPLRARCAHGREPHRRCDRHAPPHLRAVLLPGLAHVVAVLRGHRDAGRARLRAEPAPGRRARDRPRPRARRGPRADAEDQGPTGRRGRPRRAAPARTGCASPAGTSRVSRSDRAARGACPAPARGAT